MALTNYLTYGRQALRRAGLVTLRGADAAAVARPFAAAYIRDKKSCATLVADMQNYYAAVQYNMSSWSFAAARSGK